ncbi:ATP-dependent helicase [Sphingomonas daechungensis]|uniref:DNA 3'-5' helicase n=1 Tax=Sphingomonas daechungensis TaxID=1176646 RepID=A0ABX6T008_9SPHN|nr:ATP-dependent helicase [Sphingomonas daechungensis]QNP43176.1 ATP-dependent helicase [Sphingomonas daechungensis]
MTLVAPEEWRPQGIDDLEPRAWEALREVERSVCVTAGAGAGKTEFLAQKGSYLLETGLCPAPKRILAISFKRDAARNLSDRIVARCAPDQARRFVSMTFDGFTKHMLDQFREAVPEDFRPPANYAIAMDTRDERNDFIRRHSFGVAADRLGRAVAECPLPIVEVENERAREILGPYWRDQYEHFDRAYLTFAMINRLVDYMLRTNPGIRQALISTYPYVFLDEFQDTTTAQYDLVRTAFGRSDSVFTAVGDDKQKIMGWAGAMDAAFVRFTADFRARCTALQSNWRSHEDLVAIQHAVATRIDPAVEHAIARGRRTVDGTIAAIWEFPTREDEVEGLAEWIAGKVEGGSVEPHDVAILVRMLANNVEDELAPAFTRHGLILRNVARNVGTIAIQDLLAEELTQSLLPFLRLGAARRNADAWAAARSVLQWLESPDGEDEIAQERAIARVEEISKRLRVRMGRQAPDAAANVRGVGRLALREIGEPLIRRATPSYQRDADFERVLEGFLLLLEESAELGGTWNEVLDRFEGIGQVPLMTVHKSKGLEFHTVIFFGLDSRSWRSLQPGAEEELKAFFVALTRAKQRAFFTYCRGRGQPIEWLEELLGDLLPRVFFV